jgi:dCTP deaminase
MSILGKDSLWRKIREESDDPLVVTPLLENSQVGDASIDVRLGHEFLVLRRPSVTHIDPGQLQGDRWESTVHKWQERVRISLCEQFVLSPGQLVLGATLEYVSVPKSLLATVEGRSSWGRLGLIIATATTIGPGFKGVVTLEIVNSGNAPVVVYPGCRIAQIIFQEIDAPGAYSGKYSCATGPQFTMLHQDSELAVWTGKVGKG